MRLVTNSFAPLARIFRKSEYFLYRLSLSRQLSATLSATACKYLAAVGRGHTLTEAVLLGALTLLRLESLLHFVFPPSKFPQYWAFFGDLRLANARRYRGSLADFDYSARTASLSIANREKSTRRSNARREGLDFALCAGGPSGQIDANEPAVRCGFGGMLVQTAFLPYFQLLLPISWKIVPYYNCIGGKFMLYYICISVSKKRQSGLSGLLSAG